MKFILAFVFIILGTALLIKTDKSELKIPERIKVQIITNKYNDPIFTWDGEERYLRITQHMRRDALICMREQCKMVEDWIK